MKKFMAVFLVAVVSLFQLQPAFSQRAYEVTDFVKTLEVGSPVYYEGLTIIPVYTTRISSSTNYSTLDEALNGGWLTITETGGGNVPEVSLTNNSNRYIFIMGGEILAGCRQDRIIGRDVLIAPRSSGVIVPVYCVEQGRWTQVSDKFYSKNNLGHYRMRSLAQKAQRNAQSEIWESVKDFGARFSVSSRTQAYQDISDDREVKRKVRVYEERMINVPRLNRDTVGVVVAVGGQVVSADIFSNPQLFQKLWPKILKSSAFSAISCERSGRASQEQAAQFLRNLLYCSYYHRPAIDAGDEFSATSSTEISALVYNRKVVHLAAFHQVDSYSYTGQWHNDDNRIPVIRR